jgi:uncharacterized protein (TIGR02284 family)
VIQAPPDVASGLINVLIESCLKCQQNLRAAALAISDPGLSLELANFSRQQEQFAEDLSARLTAHGDTPVVSREAPSHAFGNLPILENADGYGILMTCEQTSNSMLAAFRRALGEDVPPEFTGVIETQFEAIQEAHERIKVLRSSAATEEVQ